MKFKIVIFLIAAFILKANFCQSQCVIPNGEFEEFETVEREDLFGNIISYEVPMDWIESPPMNIVPRFIHGIGFFGPYEESDANGSALLITRSAPGSFQNINSGYMRFHCTEVANRIKGRIKFLASSNREIGQMDRISIGVFYSTAEDSLSLVDDIYPGNFPERSKYFTTTELIEEFTDFEIDLSDFYESEEEYEYFTVMIKMEIIDPISLGAEYSSAVLDDVYLEYDELNLIEHTGNKTIIYPNPANGFLMIESNTIIDTSNITLFDITGRTIREVNIEQSSSTTLRLDLDKLSKGIYLLQIGSKNQQVVKRFIKR
ncbi:MAG: T9SS type A sorting domain-containing protein [Psychroserpens sp.]|uniref:T9SS type A sorting domain-containing protein n=1 Tax=Psychroserpens sp. TaxID=2020870 RepID=UPI0030028AFC